MGRVVKVVAIAAAVATAVFAPQISAALLGAIGVTSSVATALLATALAVGSALALRSLGVGAPKPSSHVGPPQVFRQSIANSFIVYGKRRVGGLLAFYHARQSGDDHFRYFVIACAGHRCKGLVSFMLNDEIVTVNGSGMVTSGPYANAAWLWFQRGVDSETANATFVSECGGNWTTNHKGNNVAAIYAKFQMTEAVVQAGMPNITAIIEGKDDIADPRGPTVGYTRNAALVFYDWMKTPREEGGFGAYADEIPDDAYISAQANVCDEVVNSEPRYAIDAVIQTGAPPSEIRDVLIVNCAGSYTYSEGKHLMRPGYWVPPSETLSENDLAGPIQVSPFLPADTAANQVQGAYIEPEDGYQGAPFGTQGVASGDIRQLDLDLAFTTSRHQAERIASIMLKRAQAEKTVVWPMNIAGLATKALDTVQLDTARYGLSNYAFQVTTWNLSPDFNVVLTLREENEDIYDAPTPSTPSTIPAISKPSPLGGPVNPDGFIPGTDPTIAGVLTLTGGQIKFPATQVPSADPNTLDDYEEGTFTPTLAFGGNSVGMTYSEQFGRYTKVGRLVFFEIRLILTARGSSTGTATVRNLPFNSAATASTSGVIRANNLVTVDVALWRMNASSDIISLDDFSGSISTALGHGDFTDTSVMIFEGFYSV